MLAVTASAGRRARLDAALFVLLAGQFMANLDAAIVNRALPSFALCTTGAALAASGAARHASVDGR